MRTFSRRVGKFSLFRGWLFVWALAWTAGFSLAPALLTSPAARTAQAADNGADPVDHSASDKSAKPIPDQETPPANAKSTDAKNTDAKTDDAKPSDGKPTDPADAAARRKTEEEDYEFYKSLADTIDQVERNYVKPVDRRELMEAAIKGVLGKLDPYSSYISPEEINGFRTTVESQFGGIGIQITPDEGQIKVSSPLVGTPAYRAGVMAGDRILRIEGESTRGLSLDDVVRRLKGEVGTPVSFTVRHTNGKEETYNIKRELIHVDTVLGDSRLGDDSWSFMLDPEQHIGYIRITAFSRDTATDLKKALETLKQQKMRGLVLDLRFNPGGLLTTAIDVCNLFISEGRIVSTKGRNTPERVWDATPGTKFEGFPMAILVNGYSASASEIVSACLQDHQRAVIIGERSWGKGSVQNVIDLEDGKSALKLTTATYTRPNGHNIHRFPDSKETDEWGVKPNDGMEVRISEGEMDGLIADRRLRDIVPGHAHEEKPKTELLAATSESRPAQTDDSTQSKSESSKLDSSKSDSVKPDANKSEKPAGTDKSTKPADTKSQADDLSSDKNAPSDKNGKITKSQAEDSSSGKSSPSAAAQKSPTISHGKTADRQLQKALDYISSELAGAK